jgi:hypothetical protein
MGRALRSILSAALATGLALGGVPASLAATGGSIGAEAPPDFAAVTPAAPTQVVVFDRLTHATTVVSHDQSGNPGGLSSSRPAISADGSFVAFESAATLALGDSNRTPDVYLWIRSLDQVRQISLGPAGVQANGSSHDPSISGNGGLIAFASTATNLTSDHGLNAATSQVFTWSGSTGAVALVSIGSQGAGAGSSADPSVSQDGRVVAFESSAADLVAGDTNAAADVFLRNLARGATLRTSISSAGREVAGESRRPSVSGNGGVVAFDSLSPALVPNDTNKVGDVFVRDLPPAVQVMPNPLDFGVVPLGTPASESVAVASIGWTPVSLSASAISGANAGDFVVAGDACAGQVLDYGESCLIAVLDIPSAPGARTATLSISDSARDSPQLVTLLGGVGPPQVKFDPAVGPPGIVTTVSGAGFPPGALVTLRWDRGITPSLSPIVVAPDGTFVVSVLVFHNDVIGPRQLIVTAAAGGAPFPDQAAPFLVVNGTLQPSGTGAISYLAPEIQPIVTRR